MQNHKNTTELSKLTSPFAPLFINQADALPSVFQEQFLWSIDAPYQIVLQGNMDEVWQGLQWCRPLLHILSWFDMLFPEAGHNVSTRMVISGYRNAAGCPVHTWQRTFEFATPRHFNADMTIHPQTHQVVEQMGQRRWLEVTWDITFQPPDTIHIQSKRWSLCVYRWRLPLPRWIHPEVHAVETALNREQPTIHIRLRIVHRWLGDIFGYQGNFAVQKCPKDAGKYTDKGSDTEEKSYESAL